MDRLVARSPEELVRALVTQSGDGRRVGEPDQAVRVHDPDRLGRRLQHRGEEVLGANLPSVQVRQAMGHVEPRSGESTAGSRRLANLGETRSWSAVLRAARAPWLRSTPSRSPPTAAAPPAYP